jgi:hypothetical protein
MLMQVVHTVATVPRRLTCLVTKYIVQSEINSVYSEKDECRGFPHFVYWDVPRQAPPNCIRLNKALIDSEGNRVVITTNIHVNRTDRQLQGTTGVYIEDGEWT